MLLIETTFIKISLILGIDFFMRPPKKRIWKEHLCFIFTLSLSRWFNLIESIVIFETTNQPLLALKEVISVSVLFFSLLV